MSSFTTIRGYSNVPIKSANSINILGPVTANSGLIVFSDTELGPPTTTTRSIGTRILLSSTLSTTKFDSAIGIDSNTLWVSTANLLNVYSNTTVLIGGNNSTNSTTGQLIVQGGVGISRDLYVGGNLNVTGNIIAPGITNSNTQLYIYENMLQTSPNNLLLLGNAVYTQNTSFQLTSTVNNQSGSAYIQADPGSSWTCQFDYYYGGGSGADGIQFFVQQTSIGSLKVNNGGYIICFDEYHNTIRVGDPTITNVFVSYSSSVTLTTYLSPNIWNTIVIRFHQGTLLVYINGNSVSGLTVTENNFTFPAGTFMGFHADTGGANNVHSIRNIIVHKGTGTFEPQFGNPSTLLAPTGLTVFNNTTVSSSSSSGSVVFGGGISISNTTNSASVTNGGTFTTAGGAAIQKDLYIGGNLIVSGTITNPVFLAITASNLINTISPTVYISKQTENIIYFSMTCTVTKTNSTCGVSLAFSTLATIQNTYSVVFIGQVFSNGIAALNLVGVPNTVTNKVDIAFTSYLTGTYYIQGSVLY